MASPKAEQIERSGNKTMPPDTDEVDPASRVPAEWAHVQELLEEGPGPCWLSLVEEDAPLVRPVFAAWTGDTFVFATNPGARKTAALRGNGRCTVAIDLEVMHFLLEGTAGRLTEHADLERASAALKEVFDWPTEVVGDVLDAPYAAPTSGGPPFEVYEIQPSRAYAFPTADQFEPTRWRWDE